MTPREVLFRALDGEPVDRVPVWLLFPYHPTGYYVDVRAHAAYRRVFEYAREKGVISLNRRNLGVPLHAPGVTCTDAEITTSDGPVRRHMIAYNGIQVHADQPGKKLLATDEDLEAFCRFPLQDSEPALSRALEQQLQQYLKERDEFPVEYGAMMLDLGSPINTLYHAADLGIYPVWSLTHRPIIEDWLDRRMRQLQSVYRFCLERELADVYFLVGSELASPPMVSRETFQRWVVPYERQLIALIHAFGKKVIQHYHGQIREILPDFVEMGPDGLHTIESPPTGNCTLSQAFAITQERICLIGNIQYDAFRSRTPTHMRTLVNDTLDEVAGRRFILSPTAGPFDASPPQALIDNYLTLIDAAGECSG